MALMHGATGLFVNLMPGTNLDQADAFEAQDFADDTVHFRCYWRHGVGLVCHPGLTAAVTAAEAEQPPYCLRLPLMYLVAAVTPAVGDGGHQN